MRGRKPGQNVEDLRISPHRYPAHPPVRSVLLVTHKHWHSSPSLTAQRCRWMFYINIENISVNLRRLLWSKSHKWAATSYLYVLQTWCIFKRTHSAEQDVYSCAQHIWARRILGTFFPRWWMSTHGKQAVSAWQTPTQTQIHVIVQIHMERHKYMIVRDKIQKKVLIEKNHNQNWVLWGQIFPSKCLGSAWSSLVLVRNERRKTNSGPGGACYWWLNRCTVAPAAFY